MDPGRQRRQPADLHISRGGFDLWNSRYILVPVALNGWMGEENGFTRIAPPRAIATDPARAQDWIDRQGWQLLRNRSALPRAWVVHSAILIPPTESGSPERVELVRTLVSSAAGAGGERSGQSVNLRRTAFVETDDPQRLAGLRAAPAAGPTGFVVISAADPQRVELRATLPRPGLVVAADLHYPGWELTIDGIPAPSSRQPDDAWRFGPRGYAHARLHVSPGLVPAGHRRLAARPDPPGRIDSLGVRGVDVSRQE